MMIDLRTQKIYALIHEFTDTRIKEVYRAISLFSLNARRPSVD